MKVFLLYSEKLAASPLRPDLSTAATQDNFFFVRNGKDGEPVKVTGITDADGLRHLDPTSRVVAQASDTDLHIVNLPHAKQHVSVRAARTHLITARYLDNQIKQNQKHNAL